MNDNINITPVKIKEYKIKQSKYKVAPQNPQRSIIYGPSGSGKTNLLIHMITNIYDKCYDRIYIFSPSCKNDDNWNIVRDYIKDNLKLSETKDDIFFYDSYNPHELQYIIDIQHLIIQYMKQKKMNKLYQILIVIDDFADSPEFTRHSKLLHQLFIRGRHDAISTILCSQKICLLSPIIRSQATDIFIYRLRSYLCLETLLNELSALVDKKTLLQIYNEAIAEPYNFLYIKLNSQDINNMFYINFNKVIKIN